LQGIDLIHLQEKKGGDPELVRQSQRKRYAPVELVDESLALYHAWTRSELFDAVSSLAT
jgi:seryl-tRNA synthetase